MMRLRSKRSSITPASGPPIRTATPRASMTAVTHMPDFVMASANENTAMVLK